MKMLKNEKNPHVRFTHWRGSLLNLFRALYLHQYRILNEPYLYTTPALKQAPHALAAVTARLTVGPHEMSTHA